MANTTVHSYRNPIIPGFNPDPSLCRDGDDYYLVTSSFEFYPGVPIYHSRNLVNWRIIAYCLTTPEQLPLKGCAASAGIYAPCLRKHDGVFFMTTTNVSYRGNFIVHADTIRGPWSPPVYIDQGGIDPSLLFAGHKTYFCSTGFDGESGVFVCEVDPLTGRKLSDSRLISKGCGGRFAEAPHIYCIDDWYYLVLAEGGTEYGHMVTLQRSKNIYGPYEACPNNPVLSHRDRAGHPIQATGHADLFCDHKGSWWLVCLGIRPTGAMLHHLGRETFLLPLEWKEGWPLPAVPLELEMEGPLPEAPEKTCFDFAADFSRESQEPEWNYIRAMDTACYERRNNTFFLEANGAKISDPNSSPAFAGVRQPAFAVEAVTVLSLEDMRPETTAGLSVFYNSDYHYDLAIDFRNGKHTIILRKRIHDIDVETCRESVGADGRKAELRVQADKERYRFSFSIDGNERRDCGSALSAGLATEGTYFMTFTGVYIGLFCDSGKASFETFSIREGTE